jgi:hypothetical protein
MPLPTEAHEQLAFRLLFEAATPGETTGASVHRTHLALVGALAPVLGTTGVQALFARSVRLVRAQRADLAGLWGHDASAPEVARLVSCLDQLPPEPSVLCAVAIYTTLIALLAKLIGDRLTLQLVHAALPARENTSPKGTT